MNYVIWRITTSAGDTLILFDDKTRTVIDCSGDIDFLGVHLISDDYILELQTIKGTKLTQGPFKKLSEYPELFL